MLVTISLHLPSVIGLMLRRTISFFARTWGLKATVYDIYGSSGTLGSKYVEEKEHQMQVRVRNPDVITLIMCRKRKSRHPATG